MRLARLSILIVGSLLGLSGCKAFDSVGANYQTIELDSQRDTALAEEEHQKALRIIERALAGKAADLEKAQKHLEKALAADVRYGPAHNSLGMVYCLRRELYLAAWEYEYAAKLMPERPEPLYNLGHVYECASDLDRAISFYETALALDPRDPVVLGSVIRARLRDGERAAELRPLAMELLLLETRPEWVAWARELVGTHPETARSPELPSIDAGPETIPPAAPEPPLMPGAEFESYGDPPLPEDIDAEPLPTLAPLPAMPAGDPTELPAP